MTLEHPIESITVVGGGDNGLLTALLLKHQNPDTHIRVVDDPDNDPPEIGKSTVTYIINILHEILEIDPRRFFGEVKPVWKASVYFENWFDREFHVPFDIYQTLPSHSGSRLFDELYYRYRQDEYHTVGCEIVEQRKTPIKTMEDIYPQVAYHLGVHLFNDFLRDICRERDIPLQDDSIHHVQTTNNRIKQLESESTTYEADLYVDATGFNRLLVNALDFEFRPFGYPLDSAMITKADLTLDEIVPATVVNSAEYGWFWQIDTYHWRDLGYVYASKYISEKAAKAEFLEYVNDRKEDGSHTELETLRWEAGIHERAWVNNCVAIGNAFGFLEPLQSTSLTLNAILAEKIGGLLADHRRYNHEGIRSLYSNYCHQMWQNVYDFVSLHYRFTPKMNDFWSTMAEVNQNDTLNTIITHYDQNGFLSHAEMEDDTESKRMFNRFQFYKLLRSLGVSSTFYEEINIDVPEEISATVDQLNDQIKDRTHYFLTYQEVEESGIYGPPASGTTETQYRDSP